MEEYLQKFGYKPLEISSEPSCVKVEDLENSPQETNSEVGSQKTSDGHCASPVLSEVGRSVIQGNDITQDLSNILNKKKNVPSIEINPILEMSKNELESDRENPEKDNETDDLVTNQFTGRPLPFQAKDESTIMYGHTKIMDSLPKDRTVAKDSMSLSIIRNEDPSTPVTPEFSEATMSLLNLISKNENTNHNETYTPEEPSMHYINHNETDTPEEPSLYYKETKKQFGSLNDTGIPEEPVLSNMIGKMQFVDTPEEPKLLAPRKFDDTPESPIFSEATMSLFKCIPPAKEVFVQNKKDKTETSEFSKAASAQSNHVSHKSHVDVLEEPALSSAYTFKEKFVVPSNLDDDMPPSPELSSYTQSFLNSQPKVRENQHSDMRKNVYSMNKYESMMDREYSNEPMNSSHHQNNEYSSIYKSQVKPHMYDAQSKNEYIDQENEDPTSYINNSSYMNKSGASNFSFITPAKDRGNANRSYSLAMERLANQNDSPDSPQLSDISMSIVNRSQRW
ncbi:unnamed protein product [Meganyctiphanes norvegica]|uniref:Uncharacterized protein n=1 Tax=Meganyctiphanes norvegica TaxID=48144 RepID=A0AAV2S9Y8_MEGNR